jgi:uncharacterized protein YidB (DUF937 family)
MSQGMPSMTALLGMLALAGFQNRDKITEMLKGVGAGGSITEGGQSGLGGLLGSLGGLLGGAGSTAGAGGSEGAGSAGAMLNNGLNELLKSFKENGQGDTAQSWINPGPNKEISSPQLKQALGSDVLAALEGQTGLSQQELLARLSRELPSAVDKYTPDGRLPEA